MIEIPKEIIELDEEINYSDDYYEALWIDDPYYQRRAIWIQKPD